MTGNMDQKDQHLYDRFLTSAGLGYFLSPSIPVPASPSVHLHSHRALENDIILPRGLQWFPKSLKQWFGRKSTREDSLFCIPVTGPPMHQLKFH